MGDTGRNTWRYPTKRETQKKQHTCKHRETQTNKQDARELHKRNIDMTLNRHKRKR